MRRNIAGMGTNFGATTIVLAQALIDTGCKGKVNTVELDEGNTIIAMRNFKNAKVLIALTYGAEACASMKSFKPKDGGGNDDSGENFPDQRRSNDTHESSTDPESRLYRRAKARNSSFTRWGTYSPKIAMA